MGICLIWMVPQLPEEPYSYLGGENNNEILCGGWGTEQSGYHNYFMGPCQLVKVGSLNDHSQKTYVIYRAESPGKKHIFFVEQYLFCICFIFFYFIKHIFQCSSFKIIASCQYFAFIPVTVFLVLEFYALLASQSIS